MAESVILVADINQEDKDQIAMSLVRGGMAERVIPCETGRRVVTEFTRAIHRKDVVKALVLEVNLPIIGGKTCSLAVRFIEQAYGLPPTPVVFFSAKEQDANLKKVMAYIKHSRFLARAELDGGAGLARVLREVLS